MNASSTLVGFVIETNAKCPQKLDKCEAFEHVRGPGALMSMMIFSICTSFAMRGCAVDDFA